MHPLVSVVIPCYNQAEFLAKAIDSLLAQTYSPIEIVVVDDGSTDETPAVIASYGQRITSIRQANAGVSAARNAGIAVSTGDLVGFLDADDFLFPEAIERHVAAMRSHPDANVFFGGCVFVDGRGRELGRFTANRLPTTPLVALLSANRFALTAVTIRRCAVSDVGGFDPGITHWEDWDWWIRLAAAGHRFVAVPDAWVAYRRHDSSASTSYSRLLRGGLQVVAKHRRLAKQNLRAGLALQLGKRSVRYYALQTALLPSLRNQLRNRRPFTALRQLFTAIFEDVGSFVFFCFDYWVIRFVRMFYRTVK